MRSALVRVRSPMSVACVGAVAVLAVSVVLVVSVVTVRAVPSSNGRAVAPAARVHRVAPTGLAEAARRTVAAGSARLEATYTSPAGPPVAIEGWTSFVGPDAEVSAALGDDPPARVRVTAEDAWLRPPGSVEWAPIALDRVAGAAGPRGWSDLLRTLRGSDEVWADASGRIVRVRRGGLDVRFSEFGTSAVQAPP